MYDLIPASTKDAIDNSKARMEALTPMLVEADNMNPAIKKGSIVWIDTSEDERRLFVSGEVYMVRHDHPTIDIAPVPYRFISTGLNTVRLESDNANHPSYEIQKAEIMPRVIGRVKYSLQGYY
jgi:hypothetical protein